MSDDRGTFQCTQCGNATSHARLDDPYAGELWQCTGCGWKTPRDESKAWARVAEDYRGTDYDAEFDRDMKDTRIRAAVHHIDLWMCGPWGFQDYSAAEKSRIAHIFVTRWEEDDDEIAAHLERAGFSLEGRMSPPSKYVRDVKDACESKVRPLMGKPRLRDVWIGLVVIGVLILTIWLVVGS